MVTLKKIQKGKKYHKKKPKEIKRRIKDQRNKINKKILKTIFRDRNKKLSKLCAKGSLKVNKVVNLKIHSIKIYKNK